MLRRLELLGCDAVTMVQVASLLCTELEYRKGNHKEAFVALRRAVELEDSLAYDEPWGWMQPVRHALGALLLERGLAAEAEVVYRADLGLDSTVPRAMWHMNNVWALHGLVECLERQSKTSEAAAFRPALATAKARMDVPMQASCYCRRTAPQ